MKKDCEALTPSFKVRIVITRQSWVTRLSGPIQNLWFCKWVMFLLRVYNAIKPVTSFCQVFKVEICEANTTVTWQVNIICHHLGTFVFRGFFMPEYCFLRRYSGIYDWDFWETSLKLIPWPFLSFFVVIGSSLRNIGLSLIEFSIFIKI